jgi:hypothetical protein
MWRKYTRNVAEMWDPEGAGFSPEYPDRYLTVFFLTT